MFTKSSPVYYRSVEFEPDLFDVQAESLCRQRIRYVALFEGEEKGIMLSGQIKPEF